MPVILYAIWIIDFILTQKLYFHLSLQENLSNRQCFESNWDYQVVER